MTDTVILGIAATIGSAFGTLCATIIALYTVKYGKAKNDADKPD